MTDNPDNVQTPQQNDPVSSTPAGAKNTEHMIPQSRLNQVIQERDEIKNRLATLEDAQKEKSDATLAEQNRYHELYQQTQAELESLKSVQEQADRYGQALQTTNQARLERLSEQTRMLAPDYEDQIKLSAWLDKAEQFPTETPKPDAPNLDGGSGSGGSESSSKALPAGMQSVVDMARQYGYSVDSDRVSKDVRSPQKPTKLTGDES